MKKWLFTYEKGSLIMKKWYGFWFCVFDLTFANSELEQYPKTNPHKLIIWFCGFFAHAFIVLLSILTAVRLFQIMMVVYFLVPTSEFTLHTPGVYKGCHNDGKVKVTTSKRCSGMLSRVSTCERASWTQLLTPFEAYGQPGHWKVPVSSCWWSHTWIYPCYGYNLHRSTGHWKLLWSLNFLDTG